MDLKDFVLSKVKGNDKDILNEAVDNASRAVEEIIKNGIDIAMNKFN